MIDEAPSIVLRGRKPTKPRNNISKEDIDRIFHLNEGAVHNVAWKYYKYMYKKFDYDDLFNVGCVGLLRAIDTYDVNHESKAGFITYAYHWIRQQITRQIYQNESAIRIPEHARGTVSYKYCDYEKLAPMFKDNSSLIEWER